MIQMGNVASLTLRWFAGLALMTVIRLLLESRLPSGAATGLGMTAFIFVWMPTVPADAYRPGSPERKVLYSRLALFLLAAVASLSICELASRAGWLGRT